LRKFVVLTVVTLLLGTSLASAQNTSSGGQKDSGGGQTTSGKVKGKGG